MDVALVGRAGHERIVRTGGGEHGVAGLVEDPSDDPAHGLLVFNHENSLSPGRPVRNRRQTDAGHGCAGRDLARQIDPECGSLAGLAVDPDVAAALLDDAVHRGQPQAGSLALLLGGEERLEDPRLRDSVHAEAGVADGEVDVRPGLHAHVAGRMLFVEIHVGCLDGELASVGHGIAGVHHQIHEDLLDLAWVGPHHAEVRRQHLNIVDVFAENPPQHLFDPSGDLIQVQHHRLQHLLAAEGQELPGQGHRALARLLGLQEFLFGPVVIREPRDGELRAAHDHRKQVVEVVRDATCEAADGFQFLRHAKLLFKTMACGDVDMFGLAAHEVAAGVPDFPRRHQHHELVPIPPDDGNLPRFHHPSLREDAQHLTAIIGVGIEQRHVLLDRSDHLLRGRIVIHLRIRLIGTNQISIQGSL